MRRVTSATTSARIASSAWGSPAAVCSSTTSSTTCGDRWSSAACCSYPGRANQLENFRAPSGTVYSYAGYLLGPVVPAIGVSATAFWGADRDRGLASDDRPPWMLAANASLEWSTDWVALLVGASLPYHVSGLQPWTAGVGLALSPF